MDHKIQRLVGNLKTSLASLFENSPTFMKFNIRRELMIGEPTVIEVTDMPCICFELEELRDDTVGAGRALRTDTHITIRISILFSPYENDFSKMDLWGALLELYDHLKDDINVLNEGLFSRQPMFGNVTFFKSKKIVESKLNFVHAGAFTVTFVEGRVTDYNRSGR